MRKLLNKPYLLFWLTALYIIVSEYYLRVKIAGSALDININDDFVFNIHDTYYVIPEISFTLGVFYILLGFIHFSFKFSKVQLVTILTKIHVLVSIGVIIIEELAFAIVNPFRYNEFPLFDPSVNYQTFLTILLILVLIAQILFIFNITYSSIKTFRLRHNN